MKSHSKLLQDILFTPNVYELAFLYPASAITINSNAIRYKLFHQSIINKVGWCEKKKKKMLFHQIANCNLLLGAWLPS